MAHSLAGVPTVRERPEFTNIPMSYEDSGAIVETHQRLNDVSRMTLRVLASG